MKNFYHTALKTRCGILLEVKLYEVGGQTLRGKESVRAYMNETYIEPPKFEVENLISQEEFVIAIGKIQLKN